jgi:oligopeptide/dipeptide ABC transporter ATP-binding protein
MLEVKGLKTEIKTAERTTQVVDGISFSLAPGRSLGIVGESGSGKSMTSQSLLNLITPPGRISAGQILFEGQDLLKLEKQELRRLRGGKIAMIFQEPQSVLNPTFTVGQQLQATISLHHPEMNPQQIQAKLRKTFELVHLANPEEIAGKFPHQLSGGQQQRVLIALAISCDPKVLIADEPTTALDSTLQLQILQLLKKLKSELGLALIVVTHDLAVVGHLCDDVAVMYAGQIVEKGSLEEIFRWPTHPYTKGLLESAHHLKPIPGSVVPFENLPVGCRFADRCSYVQSRCRAENPRLESMAPTQTVACHFPLMQKAST